MSAKTMYCLLGILIIAVLPVTVASTNAHNVQMARATVTVYADGRYFIKLTFDLIDYMGRDLNVYKGTEDPLEKLRALPEDALEKYLLSARKRFLSELEIIANGEQIVVPQDVIFPRAKHMQEALLEFLTQDDHNITVGIGGESHKDTHTLNIAFPEEIGTVALMLIRPETHVLRPGERSVPFALTPSAQQADHLKAASRYLILGFEHILPKGLDHILFVLGLFFLSCKIQPLLWQVTAFTIAHTITLALSVYGIVSLPPSVVEPLIALSITFVAVENLVTTQIKPWRPFVVFSFGLLHGLGFASVLRELGLPGKEYITALVAFNIGIELGQLSVILLAFVLVGWFQQNDWYRSRIAIPSSGLIAAIGGYWAFERIFL